MRRRAFLTRSRKRIALIAGGVLVVIALAGTGTWALARYGHHESPPTALAHPSPSPSLSESAASIPTPLESTSPSTTPLPTIRTAPSETPGPTSVPDLSQGSLTSTFVPAPSRRAGGAMVYDAKTKTVVLFGGLGGPKDLPLGDTWSWDGSHWTQLSPTHSPPARYNAAIAYDAGRGLVVLYGGSEGDYSDTWTWDGTDWTQMHLAAYPTPLRNGTMSMDYDAALDRVVIFGVGQAPNGSGSRMETWTWDGRNWKQLTPSRNPSLQSLPRAFTMAYYPPTTSLILVGSTTWAFDGSTWNPLATPVSPLGERANMAYDVGHASLVLFGTPRTEGMAPVPPFNDTWTWNGASWSTPSPPPPSPLEITVDFTFGPSMTYDAAHGVTVVFGGQSDHSGQSNIVWTWDGKTWTRVG